MRCLILALLLPGTLLAQQAPSTARVPEAIREIREADIRRDLFAMASPEMRGREGGTLDEIRASLWIAEQYKKIGLEPAGENGTWFQWFPITRTRVSEIASHAEIAGRPLAVNRDLVPITVVPVEASGPVLWISDPSDTSIDLRGRIVATLLPTPPAGSVRTTSYPYGVRYVEAAVRTALLGFTRRGASAIILVSGPDTDSLFDYQAIQRGRGSYDVDHATPRTANGSDRIGPPPSLGEGPTPAVLVRGAEGPALLGGANATLSLRLERFDVPSVNVIGRLRGTDPALRNEYVLYSSHQDANGVRLLTAHDSVLAGADDNASVSVAQFAAARAFVKAPPRRSLLFVHHGSEERGLLGSRYHSAHPVVPIGQIVAVLNGDMIGRNNPDSAALLGAQPPHRNSTALVEMALRANAETSHFVLDTLWDRPTHPEGWYFRSDHLPYARVGVPALMYSTNLHDDYHTANDVPERIDYAKLTRMARWMYLTGWYAANAARRPALDPGARLER